MIVHLGFVAMSVHLKDASPSKSMTRTRFESYQHPASALVQVRMLTEINAYNTLRILRYCVSRGIQVYRLTSKLIPLATLLFPSYQLDDLVSQRTLELYHECGELVREHQIRLSAHPDHFTVLSSANPDVIKNAMLDLAYHHQIFEWMELPPTHYQLVLHIGSATGGKGAARQRFSTVFYQLPAPIQQRLILENDDKTYTAGETLSLCQQLQIPMVLDYHHMMCNGGPDDVRLLPEILATWHQHPFPPKFHFSSPRSSKLPRAHADYIDATVFLQFLRQLYSSGAQEVHIMLEAKQKDDALFALMHALTEQKAIQPLCGGSFFFA